MPSATPSAPLTYARHLIPWSVALAQQGCVQARRTNVIPALPYSRSANDLVALWKGDITRLCVPAIAFGSNVGMVPGRGASSVLYSRAGHRLVKECRQLRPAVIGEARASTAGDLPASILIHLPLPDLYHEPTLVGACTSALDLAAVQRTPIVAFASLRGVFFNGDADLLARVLARTARLWADKSRRRLALERVVLTADRPDEYELLLHWMQIYFPSSH